jgi:hypothetical protein
MAISNATPICTPEISTSKQLVDKAKNKISYQITMAATMAFFNAATFFAQTVAYDTAEWASNGFKGQAPGIFTDPFGEYTKNLVLDSVGEFMGSFSDLFLKGAFGFDLCKPPQFPLINLELALNFPQLGLNTIGRPHTKCAWTDVMQNWDATAQSLSNLDASKHMSANFTVGGNDVSYSVGVMSAFFSKVAEDRYNGVQTRLLGNGYKDVSNFLSGAIETPASAVQRGVENKLIENPANAQNINTGAILSQAFSIGGVQLGIITASTFTNVLVSKLLQKLMKGLFQSSPSAGSHVLPDLLNPNAAPVATQPLFASAYSDLKTPKIISTESQDLLSELSVCPSDARTKWNCAMDESLATGLRQGGLTVRQAIDQGFLNENWQLLPSSRIKDNQDPSCRTRAFCVANLRKMRLARIIPIGWELAAESPVNQAACVQARGCVTLKEAISHFDDCNSAGILDKDHPYCHLVDPNWVLAALPAQCLLKGFGSQLIGGIERLQECQDTALCLQRDKDGKCTGGFGYCLAEQTYWQFDAQSCQEQNASCRTYTPRGSGAKAVSYLRSTLDYGSCDASNVGCMWYATKRVKNAANPDSGWTAGYSGTTDDRIYLNKNVQSCSMQSDGCTSLRKTVAGQPALNLVENGSFENVTGTTPKTQVPVGWKVAGGSWGYTVPQPASGAAAADGNQSLRLSIINDMSLTQLVGMRPLRTYTLSFYARQFAAAPEGAVRVYFYTAVPSQGGAPVAAPRTTYFTSPGCTASTIPGVTGAGVAIPATLGNDWTRFSCTFVTTPDTGVGFIFLDGGTKDSVSPLVDAIQLEETENPTSYIEGLNPGLETVNMKIPPEELECTGTTSDDPRCSNFARVCRQSESGCQGYRAVSQPSLPEVPAVLTPSDLCPAECVGYAEFRKQPSTFDLTRNATNESINDPEDDTVATFIPATAQSCAAQDVGCEKFTDVEAAAQGGGGETAMNYLRSCEKPGPDTQTYYTWEGSDTTGYQLKTWSLKRNTDVPNPEPPRVIVKAGVDGFIKDPGTCNQASYLQAFDPDCRQFYDPEGNTFYAYESQTVLSSDTCRTYRKDGSDRADCEKTGGSFNPSANQCTYMADEKLSLSCDISNAGCRAYIGTTGKAQSEVLFEDFTSPPSNGVGGTGTTVSQSDEAVLVGDKSLKVQVTDQGAGTPASIVFPIPVEPGVLYELTFWAKTTDPGRPDAVLSVEGLSASPGSVKLGTEWNTFRAGPFVALPGGSSATKKLTLTFQTAAIAQTFIDKVLVERVQDKVYEVKDSWNTPAVCDQTAEGIPQPQAMLGCKTYVDRAQKTVNARQFTRLCRDMAIGCTTYVNTKNTDSSYSQSWAKTGPTPAGGGTPAVEVTTRAADTYDYYIEEKSKQCPAAQVGCRAFGPPNFTQDRLALKSPTATKEKDKGEPFKTVYMKDVATAYDTALCSEKELFCESFTSVNGTDYFRAPADHACEYRTAVVVDSSIAGTAGATYDGWFRMGTDLPCYPDQLKSGGKFGVLLTGDPGFNGWNGAEKANYDPRYLPIGVHAWTGMCPDDQAECTEFRDVNDKSDPLHQLGRPYFVVNDTRLDKSSCNAQVDPARGCVLFRDMSDTSLTFNTAATFDSYKTRAYQPVAPVDCANQSSNPSCVRVSNATSNDSNIIVKVKPDRSCSEWLACSTGETVYDPQTGQYKGICTDLKLCDKAGEPEGAGVPFCSNYVNRTDASGLLRSFNVLNAAEYSKRPTGFGSKDYSGVAVPDQFQVMDTKLVPIGSYISDNASLKSKYKTDYRLAVPVPGSLARDATAEELKALSGVGNWTGRACVLKQNHSMGWWQGDHRICWVSVNQEQPPEYVAGGSQSMAENLSVPLLSARFNKDTQSKIDQVLNKSFPNTQCKAAPESDSPFGNEYVVEWDDTVNPARPKRTADGYGQTNLCEYGEACACVYKRVTYGGPDKFFEPLSTNVLTAMCVGGPRDGQPCLPSTGISQSTTGLAANATIPDPNDPKDVLKDAQGNPVKPSDILPKDKFQGPTPDQQCGDGGGCMPIKKVSLVRGVTGQCLQYDISRVVAGDPTKNECLFWNPNPILTGPGDQYHWSPTAGFKPPQSSGRYYCTSPVRLPQTYQLAPPIFYSWGDLEPKLSDGLGIVTNSRGTYAGMISKLYYLDNQESAGGFGTADGGASGGALDKATSEDTEMGAWCEEADDDQEPSIDISSLRLVTTGYGTNHGYAEYAFLLDPAAIGAKIGHSTAKDIAFDSSMEDVISQFTFTPMNQKLGCGYSEEFVDGVGNLDYDDSNDWKNPSSGDPRWQAGFREEMTKAGGKLDRRNAQIVTEDGTPTSVPVKVECRGVDKEGHKREGSCYLKTWQLDYRAKGEDKFMAFGPDVGRSSMDVLSTNPVYGVCPSDHAWFSIRAVFEDTNDKENNLDPTYVYPPTLVGPFQIVGLWVTACSPRAGPRYIYMSMHMGTADVCRELAETVSKDSHDSMAFTDRNSERGGFMIPKSGFTWGITNTPFGASLATRDAGTEPLYMSGVKQAETNPLHPPAFTFPGQTYFRGTEYPTNNWGMLSNVFARIFRIYGYFTQGVTRKDWACTSKDSPEFGQWCPDLDKLTPDQQPHRSDIANEYCGYAAKCEKGSVAGADVFSTKLCNTFSGVNRGVDCSADPDICHRGPLHMTPDGVLEPSYKSCTMYAEKDLSWSKLINIPNYRCIGDACPIEGECFYCKETTGCARGVAVRCGVFRCSGGSVRDPDKVSDVGYANFCTRVMDNSPECPENIPSETCVGFVPSAGGNPEVNGHCESHPWAECQKDDDCSFTARNFWAGSVVNRSFHWAYPPASEGGSDGQIGQWSSPPQLNGVGIPAHYEYISSPYEAIGSTFDLLCQKGIDDPGCLLKNAFPPTALGTWRGLWAMDAETKFFETPIAPALALAKDIPRRSMYSTIIKGPLWDDLPLLKLFPGFAPNIGFRGGNDEDISKGGLLCSWNWFGSSLMDSEHTCAVQGTNLGGALSWISDDPLAAPPYGHFAWNPALGNNDINPLDYKKKLLAHYSACEPLALMFQDSGSKGSGGIGTCRGGARAGSTCMADNDCLPIGKTIPAASVIATWCNPVTTGNTDEVSRAYKRPDTGGHPDDCWVGSNPDAAVDSPARQPDPALDNNACTHPPGYWPRPNLCPDPNDEYCGLMGYDIRSSAVAKSVSDNATLPTDVTPGLYSPVALNKNAGGNAVDYNYLQPYSPSPPVVAAPDMRSCTGGQCKVVGLNTLSLDGLAEGVVNGGAGSHVATLRFYAWAAHDQMPLRRIVVDWGDGTVTDLPDAFMKNHKPFCQTDKECLYAPGLTCGSDTDCPPGAGACEAFGNCAGHPDVKCHKDTECGFAGQPGTCEPRVYFGNDADACDQQFFEFRHAYTCLSDNHTSDPCPAGGACSSNPDRACSAGCAPGDRCVTNTSLVKNEQNPNAAGCFQSSSNTCRFTPRVMVIDNWGWCTGECRNGITSNGILIDDPKASRYQVLHPNGGCFDASRVKSNIDGSITIGFNECDLVSPWSVGTADTFRPWAVFPGAVQLLTGVAK